MKKFMFLLIVLALVLGAFSFSFAESRSVDIPITYREITLVFNGEVLNPQDANGNSVEPFIYNGSTYLPLRAVAAALNIRADWDAESNAIRLISEEVSEKAHSDAAMKLSNGNEVVTATYRDIIVTLDGRLLSLSDAKGNSVEPFIISGTTYLPLRAIANALDIPVDWNASENRVYLGQSNTAVQPGAAAAVKSGIVVEPDTTSPWKSYAVNSYGSDGKVLYSVSCEYEESSDPYSSPDKGGISITTYAENGLPKHSVSVKADGYVTESSYSYEGEQVKIEAKQFSNWDNGNVFADSGAHLISDYFGSSEKRYSYDDAGRISAAYLYGSESPKYEYFYSDDGKLTHCIDYGSFWYHDSYINYQSPNYFEIIANSLWAISSSCYDDDGNVIDSGNIFSVMLTPAIQSDWGVPPYLTLELSYSGDKTVPVSALFRDGNEYYGYEHEYAVAL